MASAISSATRKLGGWLKIMVDQEMRFVGPAVSVAFVIRTGSRPLTYSEELSEQHGGPCGCGTMHSGSLARAPDTRGAAPPIFRNG